MSKTDNDIVLTGEGMPGVVVAGVRYPLFFSVAAIKEYAEFKGVTFKDMLDTGWKANELDESEMRTLLGVALRAADRRRVMFEGPPVRTIDDALLDSMLDLMHPGEIWALLLSAWNSPPEPEGAKKDPQLGPVEISDGAASSD